ncbi:putative colanic acid biosynthesis acetyltransferase [Flavobacterium hungaricum]|uniref:Colanic acid biosynthesis acetyltransferase n=1 Tax=Flavobacterium hungaricum TaxID=2082725 RepID=A0ABR9TNV6_9FLAO|nr:putative colanic acid biosynthesis acetyltransferase [Flavobacterium hungaricum]MBE8727049.1 putative colanic acid biosynthesis acetyltransferase [Flavobacterium hungaricum]
MIINDFIPVQTTPFSTRIKIKIHVWRFVNVTIFRLFPNQIKKPRILLLRMFGAKIASTVNINRKANIELPWNLTMGHLSSLGANSWAYCLDKIEIGQKCCIGKDVYLITGSHTIESVAFNLITKPIVINEGCWIATGSYILFGVTLGRFSVIGAKSLVIKSTEDFDVVGGNPAKFIKKREFS